MQWTSQRLRKTRIFSKLQVQNEISRACSDVWPRWRSGLAAVSRIACVAGRTLEREEGKSKWARKGEGTILPRSIFSRFTRSPFHFPSPSDACQNFLFSHKINPLLTKLVWSSWLDIGLVLFLRVYGPRRSRTSRELRVMVWKYHKLLYNSRGNNPGKPFKLCAGCFWRILELSLFNK